MDTKQANVVLIAAQTLGLSVNHPHRSSPKDRRRKYTEDSCCSVQCEQERLEKPKLRSFANQGAWKQMMKTLGYS